MASVISSAAKQNEVIEENFSDLFEEYIRTGEKVEGSLVRGYVIGIDSECVTIDVGLKTEGRIPLKEFYIGQEKPEIKVGDEVEVYLEKLENRHGEAGLSREKVLREKSWVRLEKAHVKAEKVDGVIFGRVKGGFTVDLEGAIAFLPGSQVDIRPVKEVDPLFGIPQPFIILKMDKKRGNIIVSRRAILEESRMEMKNEILGKMREGAIIDGIVKNITDYGAFIDLGGVDGLLHITDISWRRINHPSEVIKLGQSLKVIVTKYNDDTKRVSLGLKQLEENPWQGANQKFAVNTKHQGRITTITEYGAFVEIAPGIEGLVHVSEMSWVKKNVHPSKLVAMSQEVEVMVLDIDEDKHRLSLGMKQCEENPWTVIQEKFPKGSTVEGEIKNITDFGLFVNIVGEIDGLVHANDISWDGKPEENVRNFKKGDIIKAILVEFDIEKEKIGLSMKLLENDPYAEMFGKLTKGAAITCTVKEVREEGVEVEIEGGLRTVIKKAELAKDKNERRSDRFAVGERVDAKIISIEAAARKISLSVKALEVDEEKKAIAQYGSADSGASLGDILGEALAKNKG